MTAIVERHAEYARARLQALCRHEISFITVSLADRVNILEFLIENTGRKLSCTFRLFIVKIDSLLPLHRD